MELTRLQAIVDSDNDDLRHLAAIAGGDPATFYRGSDFNGVDLRGIDLRGFNLTGASFRGALVNKKTLVDDAYIKQLKMDTETFKKLHVDLETKEDNLWFEVVTELARRRGKTSHDIINRYLSEAFKFSDYFLWALNSNDMVRYSGHGVLFTIEKRKIVVLLDIENYRHSTSIAKRVGITRSLLLLHLLRLMFDDSARNKFYDEIRKSGLFFGDNPADVRDAEKIWANSVSTRTATLNRLLNNIGKDLMTF